MAKYIECPHCRSLRDASYSGPNWWVCHKCGKSKVDVTITASTDRDVKPVDPARRMGIGGGFGTRGGR